MVAAGLDVATASPADLASFGLALYVDCGKEAEAVLDDMHDDAVAWEQTQQPGGDYYDQLDPYGDHPEAIAALREQNAGAPRPTAVALPVPPDLGIPEGMSGLDAPMGAIGG